VVAVESGHNSGTAFFVLPGFLVSCLHVVESDDDVRLRSNGIPLTLKRVVRPTDPNFDLVGFEVDNTHHNILPLGPTDAATGEVMSFGFQLVERGYNGYPV